MESWVTLLESAGKSVSCIFHLHCSLIRHVVAQQQDNPTLAACLFPIVFVANMYCTVVTEMVMAEGAGAEEGIVEAEAIVVAEATVVMTDEVEEVAVDMTVVVIAMHQSKFFSAYS